MTTKASDKVLSELYDHLLAHPFFDTSLRIYLGIHPKDDVTDNENYWHHMTNLVDEVLVAMVALNKSGSKLT